MQAAQGMGFLKPLKDNGLLLSIDIEFAIAANEGRSVGMYHAIDVNALNRPFLTT